MAALSIREKLYDYIRVADEKKLKAIYMMLEDDIKDTSAWWEDKAFIAELDKRSKAWEKGIEKGYTVSESKHAISQLRKRRQQK